jgi:hypothetical protein
LESGKRTNKRATLFLREQRQLSLVVYLNEITFLSLEGEASACCGNVQLIRIPVKTRIRILLFNVKELSHGLIDLG